MVFRLLCLIAGVAVFVRLMVAKAVQSMLAILYWSSGDQ
jgi:hypothetical protein